MVKAEMKYFAVKTTVGQERSVASILESRFHGVFLDFVDEINGAAKVNDREHPAVVFTSPKTTFVERASVYIGKSGEPSEPLRARIHQVGEEGEISETWLGEGRYDPLLLKVEGWADVNFPIPVELKRGGRYALVLLKTQQEDGGYSWFYSNKLREELETWVLRDGERRVENFVPLFKLVEKVPVASVLILPALKGYVFVETSHREVVSEALQNIRNVKARPPMPVKLETIAPHLVEKPLIDVIETGQVVEIVAGPLKGITGKIIRVEKAKREVTLELREAAFQLPISISIDAVRPVSKT
ncbi:MAG: transcription elongation factor Spt5 [Candidatus Caldarchaeum sp.]|nr:transcription elongation factor Spt5 [Candidatus Caldarchaeum sp.]MDW7978230.1 transcription elongation factor Spt5 [Candidatus Caldarchaeum sp.]MDW8359657.1 transcription elongation factor Spt5 [Candidatus Caldarchaeum sp.]